MFRFQKEQSIANIAGVKIGGQPSECPTVLAGTIFYQGHKIVQDEEMGVFDRKAAEALVVGQAELSEETGNPSLLHIYAKTFKAFERYLSFAEGIWPGPIILDSADSTVRACMARLVTEVGYADKAIYNSLSIATSKAEAQALKESEVDSAILLAYNPSDTSVDGHMAILETGGAVGDQGLMALAGELGMTNLLVDPGVTPMGSGAGLTLRFSVVAKARLGLPVGSGIHNAVSAWPWLKSKGPQVKSICDAAASAMQLLASGDFLLYGPIENAGFIFPAAAMADIMVAEAVRDLDLWPCGIHPADKLI